MIAEPSNTECTPERSAGVALVCMPWQHVELASLPLATLTSLLEAAGLRVDVVHGNMELATDLGADLYGALCQHSLLADLLFTPSAFDLADPEQWFTEATQAIDPSWGVNEIQFRELAFERIPRYLDRFGQQLLDAGTDLAGFSVSYSQCISSLALCRWLKRHREGVHTLLGGFGAFGESGRELISCCKAVDVVLDGEAEEVLCDVIQRLLAGQDLVGIPGCSIRRSDGSVHLSQDAAPRRRMDDLPIPNFDSFLSHRKRTDSLDEVWLSFEGSRGCWWGEQVLCRFCGLNGPSAAFRAKSAERVSQEILQQARRYGVRRFSAADNVMDHEERSALLDELTRLSINDGPFEFFYQIRPNVDRSVARRMRQAGLSTVQPGIEAFDDRLLQLMAKGASGAMQVRCLKALSEAGIQAIYGLLHGHPGEEPEDYERQLEVVKAIKHLSPPTYFSQISFDRYSQYHRTPEQFGIEEFTAPPTASLVMPGIENPSRVVTSFLATFSEQSEWRTPKLRAAIEALHEEVVSWQEEYQPDSFTYRREESGDIVIQDRRSGLLVEHALVGEAARTLVGLESEGSLERLRTSMQVDRRDIERIGLDLVDQGLALRMGGQFLPLPIYRASAIVIALTGKSCVGKSTLCKLGRERGIEVVDVGEILTRELGSEFFALPPAEKLRRVGNGESIFHFVAPFVRQSLQRSPLVMVDSIKAKDDQRALAAALPHADVALVRLTCDEQRRNTRFVRRNRPGDEATLKIKDDRLKEIGIDETLKRPALEIRNDSDIEALKKRFDTLLEVLSAGCAMDQPAMRGGVPVRV